MTRKTHIAVGIAAASGISLVFHPMQTNDIGTFFLSLGIAGVSAILPDIDNSNKCKIKVFFKNLFIFLSIIISAILIYGHLTQSLNLILSALLNSQKALAFLGFITVCFIGYISPHRTFTHWLIGAIAFTFPLYFVLGKQLTYYFFIGFLSHQIVDMLNKRKIMWLFPFKFDFSLYMCNANSIANDVVGYFAGALSIFFILEKLF